MDKRLRLYWSRLDKEVRRTILYGTLVVVTVISLTAVFRQLLIGGTNQLAVTPTSVPDQITQAIKGKRVVDGVVNTQVPVTSQTTADYQVDAIRYFQGEEWVVADLHPKEDYNQKLLIVMQKNGTQYRIAMGPGTNFPRGALESIGAPSGLINYLDERGLVSVIGG